MKQKYRRLGYFRIDALKIFLTHFSEMSGVSFKPELEECKTKRLLMLIKELLIFI